MAVTSPFQDILCKIYHHNHLEVNWAVQSYRPGIRRPLPDHAQEHSAPDQWGGGRARRLLHAAYTIAFLCLLRFDEVLKIQMHDITTCPYVLWALPPSEAHLCAVRALADWLKVSQIKTGYLFRKIASGDRVAEANTPMTSEQFLELFRNNLLDIQVDPVSYGTHSFRRGGCQYLHIERRWPLRRICEWGGWSQDFTSMTIVKYLISLNDDPTEPREQFFNPDRKPTVKCPQCGRSCPCA
ncbi:hypothetical protein PAXINDRAFT_94457 [Paxillus involutus ATCC 200175]|uniref:DNA breaking-rejoining enzyme n=1 Tax=Paxillus involutus ATCC 200175 TaxID=664439 RepID=A0A0C9TBS3_PAXIN|nr:hypothetical protein PAXINDRAFT_94457 [Paxillus involutus ATCC 200175]